MLLTGTVLLATVCDEKVKADDVVLLLDFDVGDKEVTEACDEEDVLDVCNAFDQETTGEERGHAASDMEQLPFGKVVAWEEETGKMELRLWCTEATEA